MVAADHPVLAFSLVIDSCSCRVVETESHSRSDEDTIDLMPHYIDRSPVCERHIVVSAHGRAAEAAAWSLIEVVAFWGLVVKNCNPAICVLAELILSGSVSISARIVFTGFDNIDIQSLAVGLTHNLVERTLVRGIESTGAAMCSHTRRPVGFVDVAWSFRTVHKLSAHKTSACGYHCNCNDSKGGSK